MKRKQQIKVCVHLLEKDKPYYFRPEQQKTTADSFFQHTLKLARIITITLQPAAVTRSGNLSCI